MISSGGDRHQVPRRADLAQRICRTPAQGRFGLCRVEPVARGFVQPRCI
jgi:hypothetical protein